MVRKKLIPFWISAGIVHADTRRGAEQFRMGTHITDIGVPCHGPIPLLLVREERFRRPVPGEPVDCAQLRECPLTLEEVLVPERRRRDVQRVVRPSRRSGDVAHATSGYRLVMATKLRVERRARAHPRGPGHPYRIPFRKEVDRTTAHIFPGSIRTRYPSMLRRTRPFVICASTALRPEPATLCTKTGPTGSIAARHVKRVPAPSGSRM